VQIKRGENKKKEILTRIATKYNDENGSLAKKRKKTTLSRKLGI
jgi:hypothetical protein